MTLRFGRTAAAAAAAAAIAGILNLDDLWRGLHVNRVRLDDHRRRRGDGDRSGRRDLQRLRRGILELKRVLVLLNLDRLSRPRRSGRSIRPRPEAAAAES